MTEKEIAFRSLVERQRDLIWHICSDYSLSAAWEVEDAFQEVLCVIWRDMGQFRGESGEQTWIYRVATNTMLMLKRKSSNRPQAEAPAMTDKVAPNHDNYRYLLQLVDALEDKDAKIVHAHLDGYTVKEIAKMYGYAEPTVARRLAKAKKLLREKYENQ